MDFICSILRYKTNEETILQTIIYKAEDLFWFSAFFLFRSFFTCFLILIIVKKQPEKHTNLHF